MAGIIIALSDTLPPWDRSLDLVALTHLDADHSRGLLEVFNRYRAGEALVGIQDSTAALHPQWQAAIDRNHASVAELASGQVLAPDDRVVLETLRPSASPPNSSPSD